MALNKQQVNINFSRGLDTKTDPWQVPLGNFLELENSVFNKQGLLQKRNGFSNIGTPNDSATNYITTYNNDIVTLGNTIQAYNDPLDSFVNKGSFYSCDIATQVASSDYNQKIQADSVKAPNGLILTSYVQVTATSSGIYYTIQNSETGQVVVNPTQVTVNAPSTITGLAKTYLFKNYFILLFTVTTGGVNSIRFLAIDWTSLNVSGPTILTSVFSPPAGGLTVALGVYFDAVEANNTLMVGFNATGGAGVYCAAITSNLGIYAGVQIDAASQLTAIGACSDGTNAYFAYYNSATGIGRISAATIVSGAVTPIVGFPQQWILTRFIGDITNGSSQITNIASTANIFPNTQITGLSVPYSTTANPYEYVTSIVNNTTVDTGMGFLTTAAGVTFTLGTVKNITASVVNGQINIISEIAATYRYQTAPQTATNSVFLRTCTTLGVVGSTPTNAIRRGVGLWSKAIVINNQSYFVATYEIGNYSSIYSKRTNQPCYFLLDINGNIIARIAYQNGAGYTERGLAYVSNNSFTGAVTIGSNIISSLADTSNLKVGDRIISSAFPIPNTVIESIDSVSQITVNNPSTVTAGVVLQSPDIYFSYLQQNFAQTQNATVGIGGSAIIYQVQNNAAYNAKASLFSSNVNAVQLGQNLAITGGILWNYDGQTAVENNFLIYPDSISVANGGAGAMIPQDYYYRVVYQWTDNQGNLNRSAPSIPVSITIPAGPNAQTVVSIPTLRMSYKTNVIISVYRLSTAQLTYYRVGNVRIPTQNNPLRDYVDFFDNNTDAQIVGNDILYTEGNIVENLSPNPSSALSIFDNRLWLVDSETKNTLFYSKQVIPGTPIEMSDLLSIYVSPIQSSQGSTGDIKCIFPMDDKLIIFKENAIYYINGTGPDNTGSNSQYSEPILITSTVGCSNQKSIVFMPNGLMFQSDKGIWLLERSLQTVYIGAPVESFTQNATVNSACLIPETNQVRMGLSSGIMLMYDYYFQQWGSFTNIPSQSATVALGKHTLFDDFGRVLQELPGTYSDAGNPVLMKFRTAWIALAGILGFQRAYFLFLLGKYVSPHKLICKIGYDFDPFEYQTIIVNPNNYNAPWGNDPVYGSTNLWGGNSQVEKWRLMFEKQKCDSIQITIEEQYDPSIGEPAGEGLTLSGINCVVGIKRVFGTYPASITAG